LFNISVSLHMQSIYASLDKSLASCLKFCRFVFLATQYHSRWLTSRLLRRVSLSTFKRCLLPPSSGRWVGKLLQYYTAQEPIRQPFSYSPPWESEIKHNIIV
jgi:hypothetical protein